MMFQRCLDGDLNESSVIDGAMGIGESDSALMLESDDGLTCRVHCLIDVIEVSCSCGCSVHGRTDAASELITVRGASMN